MPVSYRLINPAEELALLSLWSDVFNVPYDQEQQRFTSELAATDACWFFNPVRFRVSSTERSQSCWCLYLSRIE